MKRRTPLRRRTPLKRSAALRRVSPQRRAQMKLYALLAQSWLENAPFCECPVSGQAGCHRRAVQIHHVRGRHGARLLDTSHFLAVCQECHQWIHDHPNLARAAGVLKF